MPRRKKAKDPEWKPKSKEHYKREARKRRAAGKRKAAVVKRKAPYRRPAGSYLKPGTRDGLTAYHKCCRAHGCEKNKPARQYHKYVPKRPGRPKKHRGGKKGDKSKTHKGDKDYTTKKGDKVYHRKGKNVKIKGKKPYVAPKRHANAHLLARGSKAAKEHMAWVRSKKK